MHLSCNSAIESPGASANPLYQSDLQFSSKNANTGNVRETFFFNQLRAKHDLIMSPVADFLVNEYTFEVGGKNKGMQQIKEVENAYVVKDDIEHGYLNTIPLWQFGIIKIKINEIQLIGVHPIVYISNPFYGDFQNSHLSRLSAISNVMLLNAVIT